MLLGAAMAGAVASGQYSGLAAAAVGMEPPAGQHYKPEPGDRNRRSYRTLTDLQPHLSVLDDRPPAVARAAPEPSIARQQQRAERS